MEDDKLNEKLVKAKSNYLLSMMKIKTQKMNLHNQEMRAFDKYLREAGINQLEDEPPTTKAKIMGYLKRIK